MFRIIQDFLQLTSLIIEYHLKESMPIKIAGYSLSGRHKYHVIMKKYAQKTAPFTPLSLIRSNQPMCR